METIASEPEISPPHKADHSSTPCMDSSNKDSPNEDTSYKDCPTVYEEFPNENTSCEVVQTSKENEGSLIKAEDSMSFKIAENELINQPIEITNSFVTEMTAKAVEKKFGTKVAECFQAALKMVKKPSQWFIKVMKKGKKESIEAEKLIMS